MPEHRHLSPPYSTAPALACLFLATTFTMSSAYVPTGRLLTRPTVVRVFPGPFRAALRPTGRCRFPSMLGIEAVADSQGESQSEEGSGEEMTNAGEGQGILERIKSSFKQQEDDDLTFKQRLAKMGLATLLSYGFVSNMSYCVSVTLAWFGFSKKTGLSPLAPGQWKPFLAVYAGFYLFNNIVRPIRLAVSVGVTPYFDRAVNSIQKRTKLSKSASIGVVVFLANVCGTLSFMSFGIMLASVAAGVPIFPPKA